MNPSKEENGEITIFTVSLEESGKNQESSQKPLETRIGWRFSVLQFRHILVKRARVCKRRIPKGKFFVASMHNFQIDEKFDVIICVGDAITFLMKFAQWESTLKSVNNHLKDDGLFILETMTPRILKVANPYRSKKMFTSGVREFSKGYYYDIGIAKDNILTWDCRIREFRMDSINSTNTNSMKQYTLLQESKSPF